MNTRTVLLGRVSTRKSEQATSLRRQRAELEELAAARGWRVVGWFEDRASGKTLERPGLRAALDVLFRGGAEVLVVHDLDRLGRNTREMLATVDALAAAGRGLYVRDRAIDATGAIGRLVFTIFAAVGEFIRAQNVERIHEGLAHARARGRVGGRRPSGRYANVARAGELRAAGWSWPRIARELGGTDGGWILATRRAARRAA